MAKSTSTTKTKKATSEGSQFCELFMARMRAQCTVSKAQEANLRQTALTFMRLSDEEKRRLRRRFQIERDRENHWPRPPGPAGVVDLAAVRRRQQH
jgi:hypothetical protein